MFSPCLRFFASLALAMPLQDAAAQVPAPTVPATAGAAVEGTDVDPAWVVRVTGLRAVPWKSYGAMRAAAAAYEKFRFLAPDSVFSFAVMPPEGKALLPGFRLRVRTEDGREYPIRLQNGELFQLPELPDPGVDADLVSNFRDGPLRIGLLVHTRTVPPEKERLGDVRLRYEINAAIAVFDDPWEYDARCRTPSRWNRCRRPSKVVVHVPRAPTSGGWVTEGGRREALRRGDDPKKVSYRMPISGEKWGHDAIIEFDYTVPLRPLKLSEVAIYDGND